MGAGLFKRQINFELSKHSFLPLIVSISATTTDFIDSCGIHVQRKQLRRWGVGRTKASNKL
jgi:hypothetical protein